MVKLTQSLQHWLRENHKDKIGLIMFGHTELITDEMWDEYIEWCKTEDGRQYLQGGSKYVEEEEQDTAADCKQTAEYGAAADWISFDEVKPKDGQSVLAITTQGEMEVYQFDANWQNCLCQYGGAVKTFNITHWLPLPQPPIHKE